MEGLELTSFEIISAVGAARSSFMEAISLASEGEFEGAKKKIEEGNVYFVDGHKAHASLVQDEAAGKQIQMTLLLTHAEDQMMSAEIFKTLAYEFIKLYKEIKTK